MTEGDIMRACMLALSEAGCLIWRNNSGAYTDPRSGSFVRYGVGQPGGSDLIGISPDGLFLAVEIKTAKGRVRPEQQRFIDAVRRAGGIAGVCRSVDDAMDLIEGRAESK